MFWKFWKRKAQIPWEEVGSELGKRLVSDSDSMSAKLNESIRSLNEPDIPNVNSSHWRYEFCIFNMFWVWYFANLPHFVQSGATRPWLDAYHRNASEAMVRAGLLNPSTTDNLAWNEGLKERFMMYKNAYENRPSGPVISTGTVGWEFARRLVPSKEPSLRLALIMNELGSTLFIGLDKTVQQLEKSYPAR